MAHADYILHNLEIYDKAQAKLKVIHRKILQGKATQFNAFLRFSNDEGIAAAIYKRDNDDRLWVTVWRGHKGELLGEGYGVPYTEFMTQYPEFGRRLMWKEDTWELPEYRKWAEPFEK